MVIAKKPDSNNNSSVNSVFSMNVLLVCIIILNFQQIVNASCLFTDGQIGQCIKFDECRSAVLLSQKGVNPGFCSIEEDTVCCVDYKSSQPSRKWSSQASTSSSSVKDTFENEPGFQRKKHGGGFNNNGNGHGKRKTNSEIIQDPYTFETPNTFYTDENRRPSRPNDDGYFVPPGLAKKKPWRDEKTTENDYYYERVTKKPGRGPNRKGPNKHTGSGYESNNSGKWGESSTTRRPQWPDGSKGTTDNWYDSENNYFNQRTTKRNNWGQETYTTTKHPGNPNYQGGFDFEGNRPNYQQGSNVEGNRPGSRPGPQKRKRISEQKCEEYSRQITENITGLPLTTNPDPVIIPIRKCITPQQLIVGGENTTVGEFPHMAAIGFRDRNKKQIAWNCGGTLISEQFVMTAAHCTSTSSGRPVKVRLGEYNLVKNDDGAYPVDYAITEIITHPDYKPPSKYNDIALLKLSRKVTFFKHIRPACLYAEETFSSTKAIATGWGRMYYDGGTSEILQKVVLSIVDNYTCNRLYKVNVKTEVLSRGIVESQLCAGELTGGKDTCQGDSGGPLSVTNTKCIHHVIGVTSFGKSCALPNSTGVYTRVSAFVPWIESVVWPQNYN